MKEEAIEEEAIMKEEPVVERESIERKAVEPEASPVKSTPNEVVGEHRAVSKARQARASPKRRPKLRTAHVRRVRKDVPVGEGRVV